MSRLQESRRAAEAALADVRTALRLELGTLAPRRRGVWLLLAAAAIGLAVGVGAVARRRSRISAPRR